MLGASGLDRDRPTSPDESRTGKLPPVAERLPEHPAVAEMPAQGQQGGELRRCWPHARDTRLISRSIGYARLVCYDRNYKLVPDILESVEDEGRQSSPCICATAMKWSDGQPFTTEDFRYWWEDVANNEDLSPTGPPMELMRQWRAAQGRDHRRDDRALFLGEPNPISCRSWRAPAPLYHLPARRTT